jgi:hypothetical protein
MMMGEAFFFPFLSGNGYVLRNRTPSLLLFAVLLIKLMEHTITKAKHPKCKASQC